ncbi:uncharacterized protein PSFLO_00759 [Pseudozyma flocculosa]|uniref:Uncharacterized protein n=1 Tax=Pseudozyma flocculosa TaxID=84751 RepID=A0A5C3ESP9_9BASI|nr:uncharacterized protein PSFLO_00759 [Pseudozyma flocculosa]
MVPRREEGEAACPASQRPSTPHAGPPKRESQAGGGQPGSCLPGQPKGGPPMSRVPRGPFVVEPAGGRLPAGGAGLALPCPPASCSRQKFAGAGGRPLPPSPGDRTPPLLRRRRAADRAAHHVGSSEAHGHQCDARCQASKLGASENKAYARSPCLACLPASLASCPAACLGATLLWPPSSSGICDRAKYVELMLGLISARTDTARALADGALAAADGEAVRIGVTPPPCVGSFPASSVVEAEVEPVQRRRQGSQANTPRAGPRLACTARGSSCDG